MFRLGNDGICINASCSARRDRSAPPKAKGSANKNLCRFFVEFGLRRNNPELKSFLNQGPPSRSTQKRVAGFVEHGSAKHERFPNVPRSRQHSERNRALRCNYARWINGLQHKASKSRQSFAGHDATSQSARAVLRWRGSELARRSALARASLRATRSGMRPARRPS